MVKKLNDGMAEFKVLHNPSILEALGLGSCMVICLRDPKTKIAGLAHAMLPDSSKAKNRVNPLRFVDKGLDAMVSSMLALGCQKKDIKAKICGGAAIFQNVPEISDVGALNIKATREKLGRMGIKIIAEDVGGNSGRSIWFDTETGDVVITRIHSATKKI